MRLRFIKVVSNVYDYFYLVTHPKHAIEMKRWWDYRMELMWRDILKGVKDSKRHDHDL